MATFTTTPSGDNIQMQFTAQAPAAKATTLLQGFAYLIWNSNLDDVQTTIPDFNTITNPQIRALINAHLLQYIRNMGKQGDIELQKVSVVITPLEDELT